MPANKPKAVQVMIINDSPHPSPTYASPLASGADLRVWLSEDTPIGPGEILALPTGIRVSIPPGYEIQIRSRSGLTLRSGIVVANGTGTVDADYRGEIKVILTNISRETQVIRNGDRVAQMVLAPVMRASFVAVASLPESERGEGGFGSTGRF